MITLRKATCEDSEFIARMVMMALHITEEENPRLYNHMVELVKDEKTLYHWSRAVIAMDATINTKNTSIIGSTLSQERQGSLPIGLCLAYDGIDYHERRVYSFSFVCKDRKPVSENNAELLAQPDESEAGEMYVDSLAVIPEYRGKGIGRMLLMDALKRAEDMALTPTILVNPNNTPAVKLYRSVGFEYGEEMRVFGEDYHKYKKTWHYPT